MNIKNMNIFPHGILEFSATQWRFRATWNVRSEAKTVLVVEEIGKLKLAVSLILAGHLQKRSVRKPIFPE